MPELSNLEGLEDVAFELKLMGYCALAIIAWEILSYLRRKWSDWAEQRNNSRDPFVFADESRGYVLTEDVIADETKSLSQRLLRLAGRSALLAGSVTIGIYLGYDWDMVFMLGGLAIAGIAWLWRQAHKPPSRDIPEEWEDGLGVDRYFDDPQAAVYAIAAMLVLFGAFVIWI